MSERRQAIGRAEGYLGSAERLTREAIDDLRDHEPDLSARLGKVWAELHDIRRTADEAKKWPAKEAP